MQKTKVTMKKRITEVAASSTQLQIPMWHLRKITTVAKEITTEVEVVKEETVAVVVVVSCSNSVKKTLTRLATLLKTNPTIMEVKTTTTTTGIIRVIITGDVAVVKATIIIKTAIGRCWLR